MKPFVLNDDALRKGWGGIGQYWFSLKDYTIKDVAELAHLERPEHISQSAYFVSIGYIPYFVVSDEEVMHSYVDTLTNQKLKAALSKIDEDDYVESFWKYFNDGNSPAFSLTIFIIIQLITPLGSSILI